MFWGGGGGIKVNKNWRKRYNKEFMQRFKDLDILSIVRTLVNSSLGPGADIQSRNVGTVSLLYDS